MIKINSSFKQACIDILVDGKLREVFIQDNGEIEPLALIWHIKDKGIGISIADFERAPQIAEKIKKVFFEELENNHLQ